MQIIETVRETIVDFCKEFIENPYLCYTEHGLHALFYARLYNALPSKHRYTDVEMKTGYKQKMGVIQKEYPTAYKLGKPRRQHWDIAVIKTPVEPAKLPAYDYLKLEAAIEFGMNANLKHLQEDIRRLKHLCANLEQGFIVHLYRLSKTTNELSRRDISTDSSHILTLEEVKKLSNNLVEIYYGIFDESGKRDTELYCIRKGESSLICKLK